MPSILTVEDHEDTAYVLERMLRYAGYEAVSVPSGSEALRLLSIKVPAAVILDCNMPDVSGHDVLRVIRAEERTRAVPVIMYTADVSAECRDEALRLGANEYFLKGVAAWDGVLRAVEKHAGKSTT
jgi:CheY-like chemotaxis protein